MRTIQSKLNIKFSVEKQMAQNFHIFTNNISLYLPLLLILRNISWIITINLNKIINVNFLTFFWRYFFSRKKCVNFFKMLIDYFSCKPSHKLRNSILRLSNLILVGTLQMQVLNKYKHKLTNIGSILLNNSVTLFFS